ncbi:glycosyltransferase family 2 protein [Candidatus Microgenomates bacterium]|nr:glycosyltransferase family 2 protein [Candidatus Microgenomates bacterium]
MLSEFKRLSKIAYHHPSKIFKAVYVLLWQGPKVFRQKVRRQDILQDYNAYINTQYLKWFQKNYPSKQEFRKQQAIKFKYQPKISIITPTFNTPEKFLRDCIESVLNQSYFNWELCICDDASTNSNVKKIIKNYAKKDSRIKYIFRETNGHISEASNSALSLATGEFIAFLDHDDLLWPNALFEIVKILNKNPWLDFIYSDEDKLDEDGKIHLEPFFKPDWSPDYLRSINYITHLSVIRKLLINKVGGFRRGFEGAQDWDLFLRVSRQTSKISHISKILYSWRKSPLSSASEKSISNIKNFAFKIQKKVLEDDMVARGYKGKVISTKYLGLWRVKYNILGKPLVSIIIPTKDNFYYLNSCLELILTKTSYPNYQLIIVDGGSKDKKIWDLYKVIQKKHQKTKIIKWTQDFNFSSVCNFGERFSDGEYLLFLNDDTQIKSNDWIESMLEHAQREEVGSVGVKLLFPNNRIQHAGIVLGIAGGLVRKGVAGHPFKNFYDKKINAGYSKIVDAIRNCSAVTAACLMISKDKFRKVGGFDPKFKIAFNDVDFGLRILEKDLLNLYTPFTVLFHHESVSVGKVGEGNRDAKEFLNEVRLMHQRWGERLLRDPYYNVNLTLKNEEYTLNI